MEKVHIGDVVQFLGTPADSRDAWIVIGVVNNDLVEVEEVCSRSVMKVSMAVNPNKLKFLF